MDTVRPRTSRGLLRATAALIALVVSVSPGAAQTPPFPPLNAGWAAMADAPFATTEGVGTWMSTAAFFIEAGPSGQSAAYGPVTDTWEELPSGPSLAATTAAVTWTGEVVLATGRRRGGIAGEAFDPVAGSWRAITRHEVAGHPATPVWTGDELVMPVLDEFDQTRSVAAYAPVTDTWRGFPPPAPEGVLQFTGVTRLAWTGSALLAMVYLSPGSGALRLYSFDTVGTTWTALALSPFDRYAPPGLWVGDRLLFLRPGDEEGTVAAAAAYDPSNDTWESISTDCPATTDGASWTGTIVLSERYAYDPVGGACFEVPTQPGTPLTRAVEVWTGTELLRWSGNRGRGDSGKCRRLASRHVPRGWIAVETRERAQPRPTMGHDAHTAPPA